MTSDQYILCVNSGSSSLKFTLFQLSETQSLKQAAFGAIEKIGSNDGIFWLKDHFDQRDFNRKKSFKDHKTAIEALVVTLCENGGPTIHAIGHRIVHGGPDLFAPTLIEESILQKLKLYQKFAPLHLPGAIQIIENLQKKFPYVAQIACFDTCFHQSMPQIAKYLPLPERFWKEGVRRYGFHGISYESIVEAVKKYSKEKIIVAHLGSGASLCALNQGHCIDTTMGFSPTGGVVMGTRSGDLDPGVILYLLREKHFAPKELEILLNQESGLYGISEKSCDMQKLLTMQDQSSKAKLAVEMFCYQAQKAIGALSATLGGLDLLVFTGGIGENSPEIRARICQPFSYLGISLEKNANQNNDALISLKNRPCDVRVIPSEEDLIIAKHTASLLKSLKF